MTNTVIYPQNPSVGDEFTVGGTRKRWDGTRWKNISFGNHEDRLEALTNRNVKSVDALKTQKVYFLNFNTLISTVEYKEDSEIGGGLWLQTQGKVPNDIDIIQSDVDSNTQYVLRFNTSEIDIAAFGAQGSGDEDTIIQRALDVASTNNLKLNLGKDYEFTSLNIPLNTNLVGLGKLIGKVAAGTKPDYDTIKLLNETDRATQLNSYIQNTITFAGGGDFNGSLHVENARISVTGDQEVNILGTLKCNSCVLQGKITSAYTGSITSDNGISADVSGNAINTIRGGKFFGENFEIYSPSGRGISAFQGTIFANDLKCYGAVSDTVFLSGGSSAFLKRASLENGQYRGMSAIYTSMVDFENGEIINHSNGAGLVAESNSTIFAEFAKSNNNNKGVSTSYSGFVLLRDGEVQNNNGLGGDTLTGGLINLQGAIVNGNNGGGSNTQVRAKDLGYVIAEKPGTASSGKESLVNTSYNPEYNIIGNGISIITDSEEDYIQYPNSKTGIAYSREVMMRHPQLSVSGGNVTVESVWTEIDITGSVDVNNFVRDPNNRVDRIIVKLASSGNTLTIKHNNGNIRTRDGNDIVLTASARLLEFFWLDTEQVWSQPS